MTFPCLEYLEINNCAPEVEKSPLELLTPSLKVYVEHSEGYFNARPLHRDLRTVIHARFDQIPGLDNFSQLRLLQLEEASNVVTVLDLLLADPSLCPELNLIQTLLSWVSDEYCTAVLEKLNRARTRPIRIEYVDNSVWSKEFPGAPETYLCWPDALCSEPPEISDYGWSQRPSLNQSPADSIVLSRLRLYGPDCTSHLGLGGMWDDVDEESFDH